MSDEDDDQGDSSSALALALLASSWRASFFDDGEDSSPFDLGAPPALRSWAFAATASALQEKDDLRVSGGSNGSNSWQLAAARLSLLTLSSPAELAALVSGAAASCSSSSSSLLEAVVAETVSRALRSGERGEDDESIAAVAAAAAAAAAAATKTTEGSPQGIVPPLSCFLRESLTNRNISTYSTAAVATALDEILANGGGAGAGGRGGGGGGGNDGAKAPSSLSLLATTLADAVTSLSASPSSSSSSSSHSLLASLCRLRARLALCGVVACGRRGGCDGDDDEDNEDDDASQAKGPSPLLAPLWAMMLSPPPPLSLAADTLAAKPPPRNLLRPPSVQALAAAAACVAALPGSPLRPWKDGDAGVDAELALAATAPLRASAHPACRVAAAAACWTRASGSSLSLRAALGDVVLSAASFVGEKGARRAMVDAVVAVAAKERSRLPCSSSPVSPDSSVLVAARAAVTAAANRARDGSELAPTIVAAALVARGREDLELCLGELVGSGAADADAGELASDALSGAWPYVSKLLEEAADEKSGDDAGVDLLCRLLLARVPEKAAKVAAFVGLVARLSGDVGGVGDKGTRKKDLGDARPPPPLSPSLALERIVLHTLEDPQRRGSDAALASAAKLGVRLLLLLEEEEGATASSSSAAAARKKCAPSLLPSLLPRIVQRACELFAERGGGGGHASLSPVTSTLCGELAARAAAAAAAAAAAKKGKGAVSF